MNAVTGRILKIVKKNKKELSEKEEKNVMQNYIKLSMFGFYYQK